MNSIHNNPFRIAGILANSSEKELQRQKSKIKSFTSVGKEVTSEYDFPFLNKINRDSATIDKAFSDIEQNQSKVNNALFWFVNVSPVDSTAIQHLISGNKDKAIEIWEKLITDKEVNSKNYSAFNNIGTLYFLDGTKEGLAKGFAVKNKLIESDNFTDFAHTVADATFSVDAQKQSEQLVDKIFSENKNSFTNSDLLSFFASSPNAKKYASSKIIQEPIRNIESQIDKIKKSRADYKIGAYNAGKNLFNGTKSDLTLLRSVLNKTDMQYKVLADNVAKEILQCSIDYFNESQEQNQSGNYLQEAMNLAQDAKSIAVSASVIERANENISTLEGMKNREVRQAIDLLKSIKQSYDKAINEIDRAVDKIKYQHFNATVNYSKVQEMKRDALNWAKVTELIKDVIRPEDVAKIQNCGDTQKITEYQNLVDFLLSKLVPAEIERVKYLCYWKDVRTIQAKAALQNLGANIGKRTDGGCYIATMAYGDYDHPQVLELRSFRDQVLEKTVAGRAFINFYYATSPKLVKILNNQQTVNAVVRKILDQFIKFIK